VIDGVRDLITAELTATGLPSLAVGVARDGEILWEEGFGWADRARRLRADAHTPYSIASITKPFTATLLMQLVEQGRVDLDAPVEEYLGGARLRPYDDAAPPVTVRQVANHTSGLALHYQFFYDDEPYARPPMAETLRRYGALVTPAGERMQYSNLGFGILDHLVSTVAGVDWSDRLRTEVLVPLGMHRTAVGVPAELASFAAARYGADGVAYPHYDFDHPGGSAIWSSVHDLLRFAMANLGTPLPDQRSVLGDEAMATMHAPTAHSSAIGGYGVGWVSSEEGGYATLGHSGGMGGVSTQLLLVPSERLAVVALANQSSSLLAARVRIELLAALLPAYGARKDEVVSALLQRGAQPGEPPTDDVWTSIDGRWEGDVEVYSGDVRFTLDVDAARQLAIARVGRAPRVVLDHLRWHEDRLQGVMQGSLGSPDTARYPHALLADIRPRGDVLDGALVAVALPGADPEGGAPGRRVGSALAHRVRLRREARR
jgi:CubicO group peptidase (beta-lactamase class C family)